jgi:hypothetical protein
MLSRLFVSSAASNTGLPGTAIADKFIATVLPREAVLPTASEAVAVKTTEVADPIAVQSLEIITYDHVVPETVALLVKPANANETVEPDSTIPVTVTPASFSARVTLSLPATAVIETLGGVVSTLHVLLVDATEVLPAASVAVAVIAWSPSSSAGTTSDHAPFTPAVVVPNCVDGVLLLSTSVTTAFASAVPLIVGVALFVEIGEVPVTTGALGARVSMVSDSVELAVFPFPAASLNAPAPIEIDPLKALLLFVGVKSAEYVVPDPAKPLSEPPETVMSPTTKLLDDSLSTMETVAVSPILKVEREIVSATVGTA